MKLKRKLAVAAVCIMAFAALTVPAMAHGHHGGHHSAAADPQCQVEDCQLTYRHDHDGQTYCGHTYGDGHSQHTACGVDGCTVLEAHTHTSHGHGGHHC